MFILRVKNPVSVRCPLTKSRKNYSNIKASGSVPRKIWRGGTAAESFSILRESNPSRPTDCDSLSHLSHLKTGIWLVVSCNLEPIFCVQECRSGIVQVENQGQTRYTRILDHNTFIGTSYRTERRLELKFKICSILIEQLNGFRKARSCHWELITWNLGQIFEIKNSSWLFTKAECSKNLRIKNRSSSCQCWTFLVTTSLWNIAFHLQPIWLQTLVTIASESCRHRFQAFARRHLKLLCCSIRIWADALFSDISSIKICCFQWFDASQRFQVRQPVSHATANRLHVHFQVDPKEPGAARAKHLFLRWLSCTLLRAALHRIRFGTCCFAPLTLKLSQHRKSSSPFSSSEPVAASSNCSRLGNTLCLFSAALLPAQTVLERSPKSSALDFAVKAFDGLPE